MCTLEQPWQGATRSPYPELIVTWVGNGQRIGPAVAS